jgi:uncharacterized protein (DUF433 family)
MKSSETNATTTSPAEIEVRGSNPYVKGTRITVFTILEYLIGAWSRDRIAELLQLTEPQVQAAIDYIEENDLEVLRAYIQILERIRRGNPPDLQAKLDAGHEEFRELMRQVQAVKERGETEIRELIRQFREARAKETADARNNGG